MDWAEQADEDPYFGAVCLLAARGVPVSDHALIGAVQEWKAHRALRRYFGG